MKMSVIEMLDYIAAYDMDGITLTETGVGAAKLILERRHTPAHEFMLARLERGEKKVPLKLRRLVYGTRLEEAIRLAKKLTRPEVRKQKAKARRKARKERMQAA